MASTQVDDPHHHIREECDVERDGDFILAAFDSALPHLNSIGSGAQWGSAPFSTDPKRRQQVVETLEASEASRLAVDRDAVPVARCFICEVVETEQEQQGGGQGQGGGGGGEGEAAKRLPVAAAVVRGDWWPAYVSSRPELANVLAQAEGQKNAYLSVLISDYRTGPRRKGAGAALLRRAARFCVEEGYAALWLDCWAGNGGTLVRYYVAQRFTEEGEVLAERPDEEPWHGKLLKMDLQQSSTAER